MLRPKGMLIVSVVSLAALVFAVSAQAAPMAGFFGTIHYTLTAGGDTLTAEVDYAVYAPTTYPGVDPSPGDYVYVYQIFNDDVASTVDVAFFSIGLEEGNGADHEGDDTSEDAPGIPGGQSPSLAMISGTSVYWLFDPQIDPGEWSTTLLFTSPAPPTWKSGALADGGLPTPGDGPLPSPLPEPATFGLMGVGLAFAVYTRVRRRR